MKRLMIGVIIGAAVVVGGILAYRHFVTHQITDKGGMENPFLAEFPAEEQERLMTGIWFPTMAEIFSYLESYSS